MPFESQNATQLIAMVRSLQKNPNGIPLRKAFNPLALPSLIPYYILAKVPFIGSSIVQIAGEMVTANYGKELKGGDIFDITDPKLKEFFVKIHQTMFKHPCALFTQQSIEKESGLILPISTYSFPLITEDDEKYLLLYYENRNELDDKNSTDDKYCSVVAYTHLEFMDIGNGIPNETDFAAELAALSLAG